MIEVDSKKKRGITIRTKIMTIVLIPLLLFATISLFVSAQQTRENIYLEKETSLKNMMDIAMSTIENIYDKIDEGLLTESEAKDAAIDAIEAMLFGPFGNDYFWIQEKVGDEIIMIAHPFSRHLIGTNIADFTDVNELKIFSEFQTAAENSDGAYVDYHWQYYDEAENIVEKRSFVKEFEEWGWVLGTGVYINDVEETIQANIISMIYVIISIVVPTSVLVSIIAIRTISKPVNELAKNVSYISKGDYRMKVKMKQNDEIGALGEHFEQMRVSMIKMLTHNKTTADQLAVAVEELSSSAEEVSSSSENIASSQQQISRGASNQVNAITDTQKKFNELNQGIKVIREKIENITFVSEMIKNIANQTNMLALNAAIEAARAGEAGKGFNVVADQVRKLAEESKKAVDNTDKMLEEIDAITRTQEVNAIEMLNAVDSIATVAEETSASTEESAAAAEEQASSMEMISSTAQQLLALAEEMRKSFVGIELDESELETLDTDESEKLSEISRESLKSKSQRTIDDALYDSKPELMH